MKTFTYSGRHNHFVAFTAILVLQICTDPIKIIFIVFTSLFLFGRKTLLMFRIDCFFFHFVSLQINLVILPRIWINISSHINHLSDFLYDSMVAKTQSLFSFSCFGAIKKPIVNIRTIFHTIIEMDSELFTKFCVMFLSFFLAVPFSWI